MPTLIPQVLKAAYQEQRSRLRERWQRGELPAGVVVGRPPPQLAPMAEPALATLSNAMLLGDGSEIRLAGRQQPRLAPAVAFLLGRSLVGAVTPLQTMAAVEAVATAAVLLDAVMTPEAPLEAADLIGQNLGCESVVVGPWAARDIDLGNLGVLMSFDGAPTLFSSTAALLGHPARGLAAAAAIASGTEMELQDGWCVIVVAPTVSPILSDGLWIDCEIQALGRVGLCTAP